MSKGGYAVPWRDNVRKIADADPDIAWFETQLVADNEQDAIKMAASGVG